MNEWGVRKYKSRARANITIGEGAIRNDGIDTPNEDDRYVALDHPVVHGDDLGRMLTRTI